MRRSLPVSILLRDLADSMRAPGFWLYGAWIDTNIQYRSQALGAFWMVASTIVFVGVLGTLYSQVLNIGDDRYYAHLATGYVLWSFIQMGLTKSGRIYSKERSMIQNGYVKYTNYVLRLFTGQLINLSYNLLVVAGAIALTPVVLTSAIFILLLTIPLFLLAVLGMGFLLSVVGARYSDLPELIQTIMRLGFFVTPIIWVATATGKGALIGPFLYLNPFYYLIKIIRGPLVYGEVPWLEIGAVAAAIPVIWILASLAYSRAKPYIPLWI